MNLIDKDALVAEIKRRRKLVSDPILSGNDLMIGERNALFNLLSFIDTLEVKDPYEQCVQYDSIKAGIQAHAETYSFNIESNLFNQLTKEQQKLWRKEIEQACVNGGEVGAELARDTRYKENLEVKEVDFETAFAASVDHFDEKNNYDQWPESDLREFAEHFFELGLNYIKSNKNE